MNIRSHYVDEVLQAAPEDAYYYRLFVDFMMNNDRYGYIVCPRTRWKVISQLFFPAVAWAYCYHNDMLEKAFMHYLGSLAVGYLCGLFLICTKINFLNGKQQFHKIVERKLLTADTIELVCELDDSTQYFGLPVPQHVKLGVRGKHLIPGETRGLWNGNDATEYADDEVISKLYTPTSKDEPNGRVTYVIKVYHPCEQFPDGGRLTRAINELRVGDELAVQGPVGKFRYYRGMGFQNQMKEHPIRWNIRKVTLIAGGSGITPLYQLACEIRDDVFALAKGISINLIFCNKTEEDILLRDQLDELSASFKEFSVHYVVDKHDSPNSFDGSVGYISEKIIRNHACIDFGSPEGERATSLVYFCGPTPMCDATWKCLKGLKYSGEHWGFGLRK